MSSLKIEKGVFPKYKMIKKFYNKDIKRKKEIGKEELKTLKLR